MKAFNRKGGGRPIVTGDNRKTKPWRRQIARALDECRYIPFGKGVPVRVDVSFYFARPKSAKKRSGVTVRPDIDKLCRALLDGILAAWHDDAQVVELHARKDYGMPERAEVEVRSCL